MKKNNNLIHLLRSGELSELKTLFNWITGVKSGKGWINWFNRIVDLILVGRKPSWTRATVVFTRVAFRLLAKSGKPGLVLYLKACSVLLMQAVGGMRLDGTRGLKVAVSRSSDGLPRIIPRQMRGMIRGGDRKALRIWLSLFALYRVIEYKGSLKLSTITSPGPVVADEEVWKEDIAAFFSYLGVRSARDFIGGLVSPVKAMIYKSSPSTVGLSREDLEFKYSTSWVGIQQAAVSLYNSAVWAPFVELHAILAGPREGADKYWNYVKRIEALALTAEGTFKPGPVGRLGLKQEAAGKVRVFAMVDCWTQWLLKPLHLGIFHLLDRLPTDGTHNQLAPIRRLIDSGATRFWSYDLSAATDRLPVRLQAYLLNYLLGQTQSGKGAGIAWSDVLVGRSYEVPVSAKKFAVSAIPSEVMYAVGQPMGALSSWAMLALTHHFLVGVSAKKVGYPMGTFSAYAVLGDDIVIADGLVARQYLLLMRELGVEIGLAKSLVSQRGVLEFAKRYFVRGEDCSPVPLMEVGVAFFSGSACLEFSRKYAVEFSRMVSVLGYGFRVKARLAVLQSLPKRLRGLAVAWYGPGGVNPVPLDAWCQMRSALEPLILNCAKALPSFEAYCVSILETVERRIKKFVKGTAGFTFKDVPKPTWQCNPPYLIENPDFRIWRVLSMERKILHECGSRALCREWVKIHLPEVKPDPYDDRNWLTYFTIRDSVRQAVQGLQTDLRTLQMLCARVHNTLKGTHSVKVGESDLMELREAYSLSMLLRNVRQILVPRANESKESFDRVIKMRRSLAKGLREIIVSPDEIRGEGFVMLPSETSNS